MFDWFSRPRRLATPEEASDASDAIKAWREAHPEVTKVWDEELRDSLGLPLPGTTSVRNDEASNGVTGGQGFASGSKEPLYLQQYGRAERPAGSFLTITLTGPRQSGKTRWAELIMRMADEGAMDDIGPPIVVDGGRRWVKVQGRWINPSRELPSGPKYHAEPRWPEIANRWEVRDRGRLWGVWDNETQEFLTLADGSWGYTRKSAANARVRALQAQAKAATNA